MSRYNLNEEEWWPVLTPGLEDDPDEDSVEIPDDTIRRYREALREWTLVQRELEELSPEENP